MLSVFPQASGAAGIQQTLSHMAGLVNASILEPALRDQAAHAISGCPQGNKSCYAYALLSWVNRTVRYVPDPQNVELLHDPRLIARAIATRKEVYGDCDDLSMYLAALLKAVGIQPTFRAVGYNGKPWQHVYVVAEGLNLDPTRSAWNVSLYTMPETSAIERTV